VALRTARLATRAAPRKNYGKRKHHLIDQRYLWLGKCCCGMFLFRSIRLERSNMNAAGHSTRYRPEYGKPAHDCCLPGAGNPELAEFLGVAPRAIDNSIATLGAHRTRQHHPWCFCSSPDPLYRYERIILPGLPALGGRRARRGARAMLPPSDPAGPLALASSASMPWAMS
jgi:hypothetical protein